MTDDAEAFEPPTPADVITRIRAKLGEQAGVDQDLLAILDAHILSETPDERAVANAATLILALANKRSGEAHHENTNNN